MKVINCAKCNEEYAIDLNKPEEWYCPYCDNLYSASTDELSVDKLQEIRMAELKDFSRKILQGELKNQKLQEQLNTAKKALTESEEKYQKQMDRFLNSEMNESARSHCESQLKLLFPAHKAYEALAAIGNEGSGDE